MRIVIFGASSFIGKNLIKLLYGKYELKLIMANSKHCADIFRKIGEKWISIIESPFIISTDFDSILKENDIIIHLSSSTNPTTSNINISNDISTNILTSAKLFDSCVRKKVKKVIFISSGGTVYGKDVKCPIKEDFPTNPINSYGLQKLTIEKMLYIYDHLFDLNYSIIRLSNPYGPYQRPNGQLGVITTFLFNAINGIDINVYGDGSIVRDFIYIDDAIRAINLIIENDCKYKIYNIGSGHGTSINEVIENIKKEMCGKLVVHYGQNRKVDVPENFLDINRFENEFGKRTLISLKEGIHLTRYFLESEKYKME